MLRAVSELEIGGKDGETKMNVGWVGRQFTENGEPGGKGSLTEKERRASSTGQCFCVLSRSGGSGTDPW